MQSEIKSQKSARARKTMSRADALEMLSSFLGDLARAGVVIEREVVTGIVTLKLHDVAVAQDDEGTYFVPYVQSAETSPTEPEPVG